MYQKCSCSIVSLYYGLQFIKNHSDVFVVDQTNHITLKEQSEIVHSIQGPDAGSEISGVEQTLQKEVKEIEEVLSLEEGMKDGAIKMEGKDTGVLPDAEDDNKQEKEDVTPLKTKKATKRDDKRSAVIWYLWVWLFIQNLVSKCTCSFLKLCISLPLTAKIGYPLAMDDTSLRAIYLTAFLNMPPYVG